MLRNYAVSEQVSGWRCRFHRLSAAPGRRTVRLVLDPAKNNSAALLVSAGVAVPIVGLCLMLAAFIPVGQIGSLPLLAYRASGGLHEGPEGYR